MIAFGPLSGWWRVSLPGMTFAVQEDARGVVVRAAPVAAWCVGRRMEWVLGHYRAQSADISALWYEA